MFYPVTLAPDTNGTILVSFPDLPWVHTYGADAADALSHAEDALETAIEYLIRERQPIPAPSRATGAGVALSALVSAKVALHNMMVEQGVSKAELGRRMRVHRPQIDRLMNTKHVSRFDEVERAFATFGRRLEIAVRPEVAAATTHVARRRSRKVAKR